ncbi:MAG TPA: hypothetical protein PK263_00620 [bacterium]|nr:hypothetical protein [bacterium]
MSKQLVAIGGARYSGVTSIAKRICEKEPAYHYLDMKVCVATYYGAALGDQQGFEDWFLETIKLLPDGVTVIDWGTYAVSLGRGQFETAITPRCIEAIVNLPEIRQVAMVLLDVDALSLQARRQAAPFTTMRSVSSDLETICWERMAEIVTFGEYVDVLCPRQGRSVNFIYRIDNITLEFTAAKLGLWTKIFEGITTRRERMAA